MKKTISSSPKMVTKFDPCRKIRPLSQQLTSQYQTKPPVPCGGIICMAYLLSMVGVPAEAISVVVCIVRIKRFLFLIKSHLSSR